MLGGVVGVALRRVDAFTNVANELGEGIGNVGGALGTLDVDRLRRHYRFPLSFSLLVFFVQLIDDAGRFIQFDINFIDLRMK